MKTAPQFEQHTEIDLDPHSGQHICSPTHSSNIWATRRARVKPRSLNALNARALILLNYSDNESDNERDCLSAKPSCSPPFEVRRLLPSHVDRVARRTRSRGRGRVSYCPS